MRLHLQHGLIAVICILLLAACGRESGPAVELAPATLTYVAFDFFGNTDEADDALIESFESRFEQVQVDRQSYQRPTMEYLTADQPPDVLMSIPDSGFGRFIEENLLADLGVVWDQAGLDPDSGFLEGPASVAGRRYFMPTGFVWSGIYYNRELLAGLGLAPPQNWEEFLTLCDTILFAGEAPILISRNDNFSLGLWFDYLNLRLNGAEFHSQLIAGEVPFTDARVRRTFETFRNLFTRGCIGSRVGGGGRLENATPLLRRDADTPLSSSKSAMGLLFAPGEADLPAMFLEELDFFTFPQIDPGVDRGEVMISIGYIVPARAANLPHALAFLEHVASPDTQSRLLQVFGGGEPYVPAHPGVDPDILSDQQKRGLEIVQQGGQLFLPSFWAMPDTLRPGFSRTFRALYADEFDLDGLLEELERGRAQ